MDLPCGTAPVDELFRKLVEHSLVGVYLFQGRIVFCNRKFQEIVERADSEIYESDIFEFIHPEDREMLRSRAIAGLQGAIAPEPYTLRILTPRGQVKWIMLLGRKISYKEKPALLGNVLDITKLKDAEDELKVTKSLFEGLFEGSPEALAILDKEGRVQRVNGAFERLFGYTRDEAVGSFMWDLIEPPERVGEGKANQRRVLEGQTVEFATQRRRKDGTLVHVAIKGYPVLLGGQVQGVYVIYHDLSETKKAQEAALKAERRYRELVEQVPAGVYEIDVETARFLTVNDYMCKLFGYTREEFLTMTGYDLWTDEGKAILRDRIQRVLQGSLVPQVVEYPGRTKDGRDLLVRIYSRFGKDEQGRPIARVVMVDVTKERKLEEQFLHAQKMEAVGRLAGGVAHEINNSLTAVMGYADLILTLAGPGDPTYEAASEIKEGAKRAASITSQLLAFSRKQIIRPKLVDLNELVQKMAKMLSAILGEDILLKTELWPSPLMIEVDPAQMEQVIINLAVNARDAMPNGGRLLLQTSLVELDESFIEKYDPQMTAGQYVSLKVRDTGVGMDQETLKRIFEPFFTTKEIGKGTGLGLSTVYGIVKQSGGHISVSSEPGKGTTFEVFLPWVQVCAEEKKELKKESPEPSFGNRGTILVVEDSDPVRKLIRTALERFGYQILEAENGQKALEILANEGGRIQMILTDVVLPGISGPELVIKARERLPRVKALFISGYPQDRLVATRFPKEDSDFMEKPFSPFALAEKVGEILLR